MEREYITNLSLDNLKKLLKEKGQPEFRYQQILQWVYQKRINSFSEMKNIPNSLRNEFSRSFHISKLKTKAIRKSSDGNAVKFAFETEYDEYIIESVLIYDGKRRSLCISSQLGCGLGCTFCETAKLGFIRNLEQYEILGQLIAANDFLAAQSDKLITNIVFMGMGEALSNYSNFISSLDIIMDSSCFGIGGRKITVSTAGVIPALKRFLDEKRNINIAISLNSFNNEKRSKIMPINKRYPIEDLVDFAVSYYKTKRRMVTFEYVVIEYENDTPEAADNLVSTLKNVQCKINLIPLNDSTNCEMKGSSENHFTKREMKGSSENRFNNFAGMLSEH
ncbi:MAG: 23S rRNA (adenine(2503)-C(2))-methyltransferase RlmN, partial [Chitinispirillia bacterium]